MRLIKYLFCSLLLLTSTLSIGQVQGKLTLLEDNKTYQVSIIPERTLPTNASRTNSAQITLLAPVGGLNITNFQAVSGIWEVVPSIAESPSENPGFSYYFIELKSPMNDIAYTAGIEMILFTFENAETCIGDISIIDDQNDPFLPPNSLNLNVGNLFTVLGYGPTNAYIGSSQQNAPCPDPLDATASITVNNLPCHDDVTTMVVEINGGEGPFTIIFTNTETGIIDSIIANQVNTPITLQNISKGSYDIFIKDVKNANTTLTQTVIAPEPIELEVAIDFVNCAESMDGKVEITQISGGTGLGYQYEWSNGLTSTTLINNLSENTYTVTVTDENGCTTTKDAIVKMDGWLELEAVASDVSCFGAGDGTIEMVASGKNPPFAYTWSGNGESGTTNNLSNLQAGTYDLVVTDATGVCNQTQTLEVQEPAEITADALVDSSSICELKTESLVTINNVQNNRGAVQYSLDGIDFNTNNAFTLNAGESYTLTVQDETGCTADIAVNTPEPSGLEVSLPTDLILRLGDDLEIDANVAATSGVNIEWTPADGLSCTDCPNPMATPTRTTTYTITVSDDNGCFKEASVIVYLSTTRRVYTPNAFSPNGDGINDLFTIFTTTDAFSVNTLQIFDRWGERVYQSPDGFVPGDEYNHGWNGIFNGQKAPNGVYVFLAEITFIDGKTEIFSGEVNLIR